MKVVCRLIFDKEENKEILYWHKYESDSAYKRTYIHVCGSLSCEKLVFLFLEFSIDINYNRWILVIILSGTWKWSSVIGIFILL